MATNDKCSLLFKDKQKNVTDNGQYNNLTLNKNHQISSDAFSGPSKIVITERRKVTDYGKIKCCSPSFYFAKDSETKKECHSWNKSTKDLSLKVAKNGCGKEDKLKKGNSLNASTLSLYIKAYENSNDANLCNVTKEDSKKNGLIKKGLNAKQIDFDSKSVIQNTFEFSRQQENDVAVTPEIAQYRASQRLLNPNLQTQQAPVQQPLTQNPGGGVQRQILPNQKPQYQAGPSHAKMTKPRRFSVDHWQASLVTRINNAKESLSELWDEMALSEEQRKERLNDSEKLVFDLLDDMVKYEQKQLEEVKRKCLQYRKELEELRHELGMGPTPEATIPKGLAPSGNWLKNECKILMKKKKERMSEQLQVYDEAKAACDRVGWDLTSDNITTHIVPTSLIMEWKKQKIEAEAMYKVRMEKIKELQSTIRKIVNHIGRKEFGDQDLMLVDMDYDKYETVLSEEIVKNFKDLHDRAHQFYNQWYETIQFEYDELMIELQELWELCIVAECDRFFPKTFNPEIQSVDDIENLRNEISQLKLKYTEGKIIYDKLREWLVLWKEKLEYEDDSKNSKDKYNNRGGSLQARLKREAQLKNLVPSVLSELEALCKEFAKTHENIPTAGPGRMHAAEYARWLVQSYEDEKRIDKETKEDLKRAQLAQESRFGVSPSPSKSTIHRTRITPASIRKTPRKPMYGLNASKSLQASVIEPVSTPIDGPKTSSPKDLIHHSPRRLVFSPALSSIPSSPLSAQRQRPQQPPKSPSRPWRC